MARRSKTDFRGLVAKLRRGIEKHWNEARTIHGVDYTQAELVAFLQKLEDHFAEVERTHAVYKTALAKRGKAEREAAPLVAAILEKADAEFGNNAVKRADFGLGPRRKKGPKTVEAKVLMVEKARATRKKRGTMGKRQRKKIRGW
ncbi:MAG TPA: hypothetical protein VF765_11225 [Polyangiaceae bacterium]